MPYSKRVLCLAASRKHQGYCVAGKDVNSGEWVRPISARPGHEISDAERVTAQGHRCGLLDIIDISLTQAVPTTFQVENHLNNQAVQWQLAGTGTYDHAAAVLDPVQPLWMTGYSSYNGMNDQVPEADAAGMPDSLRLIRVPSLTLLVHSEGGVFAPAKRVVRAQFEFCGAPYWLKLTDPILEHELRGQGDGAYEYENAIMCVSLGETFNGYAYKLVASVIVE
jgi:hypothetical protein